MDLLLAAYNRTIESLPEWYELLHRDIEYGPGKTTSLGVIYWAKGEFLLALPGICSQLARSGIADMIALLDVIRTPARVKRFSTITAIDETPLRVLSHDIRMWLPDPINPLVVQMLSDYKRELGVLLEAGFTNQIQLISACRRIADRHELSHRLGIDEQVLASITKICDCFRMGGKQDAIRPALYYMMGFDTFERWTTATISEVIACFEQYMENSGLAGRFLTPFPKEIANTIAWAKVHDELFHVEY